MEFGRVDNPGVIDFTLRPDPPFTSNVLKSKPGSGNISFYFGTSQWTDPAYPGTLYPPDFRKGEELIWYAKQFNCIEFNPSFYAIPQKTNVEKWARMVDASFQFCCKVPKSISHAVDWSFQQDQFAQFLDVVQHFGRSAGPVFLQLPPHVKKEKLGALLRFLSKFTEERRVFVEFRHESWFQGDGISDGILAELANQHIGLVISDVSGRRDAAHMALTIPEVMVRWVGNLGHETDIIRLKNWAERIQQWKAEGLEKCWFFLHQPDPGFVPVSANWFSKELNGRGIEVKDVRLMEKQASLF